MESLPLALSRASYEGAGAAVLAVSWVVALTAAFILRPRVAPPITLVLLVLAGAGLGLGGMMLRLDPHPAERIVAIVLLAVLVPAHVRIVLGAYGRRRPA